MFVFWMVGPLMSYIMLFIHLMLLLILVRCLMWGFTHGSKPYFYFRIYFQRVCFCSFARYVTDPATWTSTYLWDPSLPKQPFIAHAWISVWGERAWNGDFTIVVMAASTCAPLRRFGLIFLNVLLTEKKDTDSDFLGAFASLTDLALGWSETLIPGNNFSSRLVWFHPLGRETAHTSCRTFNCRTAQLKPSAIGVFIQFCTTLL